MPIIRTDGSQRLRARGRFKLNDDAEHNFYAPLTTSLKVVCGYGVPTFTRSTSAWGFDNAGVMYEVPSGAARFTGARCVYNKIPQSENLSTGWTRRGACTVTGSKTDPYGKPTAYQVDNINSSGVDDIYYSVSNSNNVVGAPLYYGFWLKRVSTTGVLRSTITSGSTFGQITINLSAIPDGWIYIDKNSPYATVSSPFVVSTTNGVGVSYSALSGGPLSVQIWGVQSTYLNSINENAPDYVSRGVLTGGVYHGAGTDGVKFFDTDNGGGEISEADLAGVLIEGSRTNNLRMSRDLNSTMQNVANVWVVQTKAGAPELVSNGTFGTDTTGWVAASGASLSVVSGAMRLTTSGGQYSSASQAITVTPGATYVLSFTYTAGTVAGYIAAGTTTGTGTTFGVVIPPGSGTYTATFTPTSSTVYVNVYSANTGTNGQYFDIDNISLKESAISMNKNATGIDGLPNSCTTLTANEANATILQNFTMASAARSFSAFVKRKTGTGKIYLTRDNGSSWTDVTAQINPVTFSRVSILNTSVTDPTCGFKIEVVGDEIIVDCCQDEAGANFSSPIPTTTASVTRNADVLTYSSVNIGASKNTCYHEARTSEDTEIDRRSICYTASTNNRAQWVSHNGSSSRNYGFYGTGAETTVTGAISKPNTEPSKCIMRWDNGGYGSAFLGGVKLTDTASTVSVTPTTIDVGGSGPGAHLFGSVKNIRIWTNRLLTDEQCMNLTA